MAGKQALNVHKVVLSTKKEVLLRELKISHQELAMQNVASRAGDNTMLLSLMTQKELLKLLLVQVDGKKLSASEVEDLDDLFTFGEYAELMQVLGKLAGTDTKGQPKIEFVTTGE